MNQIRDYNNKLFLAAIQLMEIKPYRTRLDYETSRSIDRALAFMDHHIEGLREVIPLCARNFEPHISPDLYRKLMQQLGQPLRDYMRVSDLERSEKFSALFSYDIPQEAALAIINSVNCLTGDKAGWKYLSRKFFRYVFDIHTGLVDFTEDELK